MPEPTCTPENCVNRGPRGGICKSCANARALASYYANHAERNAFNARYRAEHQDDIRRRNREYYAANKEYFAEKYERNRDVLLERKREQRAANPGAETEHSRRWRAANPERYALRNRENSRRRQTGTTRSRVAYAAVLKRDGMVCHICNGAIESLQDLHFDHVVPLSRGGAHHAENIRPAHALCNMRKSDKLI